MSGFQIQEVEQGSKDIVSIRKHRTNRKDPKMQVLSTNLLIVLWEAVIDLSTNFLIVSSDGKWVFNTVEQA